MQFMEECYSDSYNVCDFDHCVDEAVAVIFDYINTQDLMVKKETKKETEKADEQEAENDRMKQIMVLDCGGGTTDLAACDYRSGIAENGDYRTVEIFTRSENGDNGFGGNNITYKIIFL